MLLDSPTYPPLLFELAEDSFQKGYKDTAAYLYEKVAESEKHQHSERLAVCQIVCLHLELGKTRFKIFKLLLDLSLLLTVWMKWINWTL